MHSESPEDRKKQAVEEASQWLERLERTLKGDEVPFFREWLKAPQHREIIVEKCVHWHGPEILAVLYTLIPDAVVAHHLPPRPRRIQSAFSWILAICLVGLSTALLLGNAPWAVFKMSRKEIRVEEIYRTPLGGRREVHLPDGGRIAMNTATDVFVHYGPTFRSASLLRGEAMFDAPQEGSRSFQLYVGTRVIDTDGARFNVRRRASGESELTVLEGEVTIGYPRVSAPKTPAQLRDPISYSYGEATVPAAQGGPFGPGWQAFARLTEREVQTRLAWRQGLIIFTDEPLGDAMAETARYVSREFVFADRSLRNVRISGEFRTGDVDSVLRDLRNDLGIGSRTDEQGRIVLTPMRER